MVTKENVKEIGRKEETIYFYMRKQISSLQYLLWKFLENTNAISDLHPPTQLSLVYLSTIKNTNPFLYFFF